MADLRDLGAIEEDSDVVCLLFREAVYLPEDERPKPWEPQALDFIVEKNRHGMTGRIALDFIGMSARIIEGGNLCLRSEAGCGVRGDNLYLMVCTR